MQESCSLQTKHGAFVPFIFPSEFVWHLHEHLLSWGVHLESLDLLMTPGLANSKANHGFRLNICLSDITSFLILGGKVCTIRLESFGILLCSLFLSYLKESLCICLAKHKNPRIWNPTCRTKRSALGKMYLKMPPPSSDPK